MADRADLQRELRYLVDGFQVSQALSVMAQLGIADLLADGPLSSDELAARSGADPRSLYRLLRAVATVGVLDERPDGGFGLTPLGDGLRADAAASIAGWATYIGSAPYWAAWGDLAHSVRTGENAFRHVHGTDVWTFRSTRPDEGALFNRTMASLSSQQGDVVAAYDFAAYASIGDIGGGTGAFLARILAAAPEARGVLFDLPHVVAGAPPVLDDAGVADRCEVVAGSFFDGVPAGLDLYVLRAVLHDWEDDDAVRILAAVRRAVSDHGRVVVVERVVAGPNEGRPAKWSDLNMLVLPGGLERTVAEYDDVLRRAGFRLTRVIESSSTPQCLVEGAPA
jgi:O-methyltransferase/methyltransferase family protein